MTPSDVLIEAFDRLPAILPQARNRDIPTLAELVAHNVAIKARVVEADPLERGERAHLNFGHTFAHAFETISNFAYSHGEAVGLGALGRGREQVRLRRGPEPPLHDGLRRPGPADGEL